MFAATPTKLSLSEFARIMGISPLHMGQVTIPELQQQLCSSVWWQDQWQSADRIGRNTVAAAIADAEAAIEAQLHYRLLPAWEEDERATMPQPYRSELISFYPIDERGFPSAVSCEWKYFRYGGVRATSVIDAGVSIAWDAPDVYGWKRRGTVTVATTVTDPEELRLYYPGFAGDDRYEIRPATVSIAGGTATITFPRECAVLLDRLEDLRPTGVDGTVDANFLSSAAVVRVYNDPSQMATLLWNPPAKVCSCTSPGQCPSCSFDAQTACLVERDQRLAWVNIQPADWDAATASYSPQPLAVGRAPDQVRLWYRAGWQDNSLAMPTRQLDRQWARAVAYFAASLLDRSPCDCNADFFEQWRNDYAYVRGGQQFSQSKIPDRLLANPLGTKAGAVWAWQRILAPGAAIGKGVRQK